MRTQLHDPTGPESEIESLRALVAEKEQAFRLAQERINNIERDWLYTSCRNFRGTLARLKRWKNQAIQSLKTVAKILAFVVHLALTPFRVALRLVGIGRRLPVEKEPQDCRLRVGFTEPLPATIAAGKGNSFLVGGWAFHPERRITQLELRLMLARAEPKPGSVLDAEWDEPVLVGDLPPGSQVEFTDRLALVTIRNIPNRQVLTDHYPDVDPNGNSFWSGYQALVTIPPQARPARAQLTVKAYLDDGTIETVPLGKFSVQPSLPAPRRIEPLPEGNIPLVAVCMTTYNPPAELFRRQIDSIRNQTHTRWVCFLRDDGSNPASLRMIRETIAGDTRFVLRENPKNLGFYKNFEAVLADVPPEFDFVALADQDDRWHPDKLETLLNRFTPGTTLVYSDMNITDEAGHVKAGTYWTTRDNNFTHYPTLLLANTVTGAASMVRRNLLDYLLPFPERHGDAYHDHWLGCVAMALGEIKYVDRPLYDYTQHSGNVVGHVAPKPGSWLGSLFRFCAFFYPLKFRRNVNAFIRHGRGFYFADLVRIQHTARNVLQRCAVEAAPDKVAALRRVLTMADTLSGRLWLALRPLRRRDSWRRTVGVEFHLLHAIAWRTHLKIKAWWGTRLTARGILKNRMAGQLLPRPRVIDHIDTVAAHQRITAPLTLAIRDDAPPRVNVVVSIIDFKYVFGGYITVFHLCRRLVDRGFRVRLIVTDECDFRPVSWADNFRRFPGLEDFLDRIELVYCHDRTTVVPVGPRDTFLATSWWTAHIARQAMQDIGKDEFVYLIQEFEPGFYPYGTLAASAAESYSFPHRALFSTDILQEFFRLSRTGVYARPDGDELSASFQNAITSVGEVTAAELQARRTRRLLFYCRPEPHALRNMFDTGVMALRKAVAAGAFRGWEFHGIGSMGPASKLKLADGVFMSLLPRMDQEQYRKILREYDVGLSLMYSPHPSLVPIEMAGAGMLTVTNGFANKSAERLLAISTNFLPTPASVEGVTRGLFHACALVKNYEARAAGARINWATTWDESLTPEVMDRLAGFLRDTMAVRRLTSTRQAA
jgi:glycosyltransferase involved in cell wall biosynthesis